MCVGMGAVWVGLKISKKLKLKMQFRRPLFWSPCCAPGKFRYLHSVLLPHLCRVLARLEL